MNYIRRVECSARRQRGCCDAPAAEAASIGRRAPSYVYAETPFMQQVHGGAYDFHRFTHLGYLRLFRRFEEVASGASAGPATVLAWSYDYFLSAFVRARPLRQFVRLFARLTAWPLKYFDHFLLKRPGALDGASVLYFIGKRSEAVRDDRDIVASYRGANP